MMVYVCFYVFLVDRSLLCCTLTCESIPKHLHCGSNLQMATQMICVGVGGAQICSNSTSYLNEMCTFAGVFLMLVLVQRCWWHFFLGLTLWMVPLKKLKQLCQVPFQWVSYLTGSGVVSTLAFIISQRLLRVSVGDLISSSWELSLFLVGHRYCTED